METRCQVEQMQSEWHEELQRIGYIYIFTLYPNFIFSVIYDHVVESLSHSMAVHHVKAMEVTSSSYHKVLEENRLLYNEVQDLKGITTTYYIPCVSFVFSFFFLFSVF